MSRKRAKSELCRDEWADLLRERGVTLLGAGQDEAPGAYKGIRQVMRELADIVGEFTPRIVKMDGN